MNCKSPFLTTLAIAILSCPLFAQDKVPWVKDFSEAQRLAAANNLPIMLHFTADWCGPCQRLKKGVFNQDSFVHALGSEFVPVKIDVGTNPQIAEQLNVSVWPTDIILAPNGQELHRMVSPQSSAEYLSSLRQVSWRYRTNGPQRTGAVQVAQNALPPAGNTRAPRSSITAPVAEFLKRKFGRNNTPDPSGSTTTFAANGNVYQQPVQWANANVPENAGGGAMQAGANMPMPNLGMAGRATNNSAPVGSLANPLKIQEPVSARTSQVASPTISNNGVAAIGSMRGPQAINESANTQSASKFSASNSNVQPAQFVVQPPQHAIPNLPYEGELTAPTSAAPPMAVQAQVGEQSNMTSNTLGTDGPSANLPVVANVQTAAPNAAVFSERGSRQNAVSNPMAAQITNPGYVPNPMATANDAMQQESVPHGRLASSMDVSQIAEAAAKAALDAQSRSQRMESETIYNEFVHRTPTATSPASSTPKSQTTAPVSQNVAPIVADSPIQPPAAEAESAEDAEGSPKFRVHLPGKSSFTVETSPKPVAEVPEEPKEITVAMDGCCPVALFDRNEWIKGDKRWGARHRGNVYLFHNAAAQQKFLANPDLFSPILAGYDPVEFRDGQRYVSGTREHGIRFQEQVVLFSSEENLERFSMNPDRYLNSVRQAMESATTYR